MNEQPPARDNSATRAAASPGAGGGLTTGTVARRIGVSPATLRSWDRRYGIGPSRQREGGHRRWTGPDILVLEEMCRLTSAGVPTAEAAKVALLFGRTDPAGGTVPAARLPDEWSPGTRPTGSAARQISRGLGRAAVRLDAPTVERLLDEALTEYGTVATWEDVMVPALRAVGRKWAAAGDRYVEVEHLLSWHVSTALRRPAYKSEAGDRAPVLLACVPGEGHTLAIEALVASLAERGLPVRMFGGAVPAPALDAAVRRTGPCAVVLWAQSRSTASRPLAQHVSGTGWGVRGSRLGPAVMVAGPGWAGPHLRGTLRPQRLGEAVDVLTRICESSTTGPGG
ncbi:MerR family transcriptional regulator [Streptomyces tsukubensis]|uniref:Transcriptional regulator n=1 Tax=Streptomyces tsukubensis TaxID=83656 RepID=A0A1V4A6P1_9ACTN|nr:MerR family transcriptional regulator [Streptomyces tsukubensis]OON77344.1 transcriptional regulator [Streptomyces tsukubensis]QFR92424.1 MerR family transcriptional regulator [Streptomyces tsukubensis]